ncbi:unnamed protein product [Spirodela intermedia]|uniref:4Fe-4S ferredoxin-type domain-containing protein n=1 Tax=Spirodela intermedia TaxID=51605 RepID=A0A7I8JWS4_SPIIN|nr:unnamed protein product [Spirodela intermedia]
MLLLSSPVASITPVNPRRRRPPPSPSLDAVRRLVDSTTSKNPAAVSSSPASEHPIQALRRGDWVKLICGASFEDAADVRNLSLLYALAGVDCIDCAADASVVNAVVEGVEMAMSIAPVPRPWVMISINDDQADVHFRKAEFDPEDCPPDCSRPCERVCPANAISLERLSVKDESPDGLIPRGVLQGGVITERCYGCGRCFPVCPYDKIRAMTYIRDVAATSELLKRDDVDAVEIHTSGRHPDLFRELWNSLGDSLNHMKLIAISLPNSGESTVSAMDNLYLIIKENLRCHNLWQLDGRPMSGDIGRGTTKETIDFAVHLAAAQDRPPGFLQLAGGTNAHTVDCLKKVGLFQAWSIPDQTKDGASCSTAIMPGAPPALIGGVAFGGYARKIVGRVLSELKSGQIEDHPEQLLVGLREALNLVGPMKCGRPTI